MQRLHGCLDLLKVCSESFGTPPLHELSLAMKRTNYSPAATDLQRCRDTLRAELTELARTIIEPRLLVLGLPSNHEGTDISQGYESGVTDAEEEDLNPWQKEVADIKQALAAFNLPTDTFDERISALLSQAENGLESRTQSYDVACLRDAATRL
jgi:hypothetical protein